MQFQSRTERTETVSSQDRSELTAVIAPVEVIREILCGPQDHNEHVKGWRWFKYVQDDKHRMANVWAALNELHAARRARIEALRNEADQLEAA